MSDDRGLVWPEAIAPFRAYLVSIGDVNIRAEQLYNELNAKGVETLWDDRDVRPGEKFADADLIGIPWRIVVSEKTLAENKVELKARTSDETNLLTVDEVLARLVLS